MNLPPSYDTWRLTPPLELEEEEQEREDINQLKAELHQLMEDE